MRIERKAIAVVLVAILSVIAQSTRVSAASRAPVRAKHAMVASTSDIASRVGVEVMKKGGNAVDAAIAVALALAVTWPSAGNIGGGGFMIIRLADGSTEVIDYRERAPLAATRNMYADKDGKPVEELYEIGHKSVAVPGTIAGLAVAHQRHANLSWAELVDPARRLAADGFIVSQYLERSLAGRTNVRRLSQFPESKRIFLRNGNPYREGELFRQPELAATLRRIQEKGPREFYEGETAELILNEMRSGGGIITGRDLREYKPTLRKPLRGRYRGYEVITMPPPSSGGTALLEMLNMLELHDVAALGHNSAAEIHLLTETMRRAFADRAAHLGDTDFVKVPVAGLINKRYAASLAKTIQADRATPSTDVRAGEPAGYESPSTTHFSIVDEEGNVVSNTYTLEDSYGSAVTVHGAGFLLNDEMGDFAAVPGKPNDYGLIQGEANAIAPRKRPLSSMTPAIVQKDGKVFLVIGSPGGPTIINTVLQIIVNIVDHKMNLQEAIDAPRVHHQWMPDEIRWEPMGVNVDTRRALEGMGHKFKPKPDEDFIGDAQGIMIDPSTGFRLGASDPRRGGQPAGY